ncbi:MAG: hypothetical protein HYT08_02585 [Candidatus Levybacteria bacterium]|nr:hypothetical protein [Candidatus Levybacteria bacterium]
MSQFLERELRKNIKSDKTDKAKSGLARTLIAASKTWREAYGEIAVPRSQVRPENAAVQATRVEVVRSPLSPEIQKLVEHMEKDGFAVYETSGKTPASLRGEGMKYWYLNPTLEDLTAEPALLAFSKDPAEFYLKGSQDIPYEDQLVLLEERKMKVERDYTGAGLVTRVGHFPEWPELALKHFKKTGVRVHGKDYGYNYTWTDTYENDQPGASRAIAGRWPGTRGFDGGFWNPDYVSPRLRLVPLVEIPRK